MQDIPKLYETDGVPFNEKTIYQMWQIRDINFIWLIAELDPEKQLAFGYANLNDDQMAEWGYISIKELEHNGVEKVDNWKPVKFGELNLEELCALNNLN